MNSEQQIIDGEYFADNAQFIHRSLFYNSPFMFSIVLCDKLSVSKFQWRHSYISSEILAKERGTGEV